MNRIDKKFKELKNKNKKAFIAFITAGYPSLKVTERLILEFAKIGVDIVELGVPFSDPMADGPIIQESSQFALKKNVHLVDILNLVRRVRKKVNTPICLMTYYNPIFCFGEKKFVKDAVSCGVDGIIVPDLPPEEGRPLIKIANRYKLAVVCFISPTTSRERIKRISAISKGFIYYVSLTGVTGPRQALPSDIIDNLKVIKNISKKNICVGFGISSPRQVEQLKKVADGVIVGSAIVKKIKENLQKKNLVEIVVRFVASLNHV